ncbi:MAG: methionine--tRNA ligase [Terriglobales bacterium]
MSKKFYITTPIYYVNARPHIGHAYTTIACDTIARRQRMMGFDTYFLTGTDEHGQKIERAAQAAGKTPQQLTNEVSAEFRALWDRMGLTYDDFIRTTSDRHKLGVQALWRRIRDNGYIYKGSYSGQYCVFDELYVDVTGPGSPCPECGRPTETVQEENYFFKLSAFQDKLLELYAAQPDFIRPETRRNEVISFVRSGLRDLSVSRSTLSWGIPVPDDPGHVIYVWLDALTNYITALGYGSEDTTKYDKYWPADVQMIGKEIVRFHCVYWPAFLMAAGLPLPRKIAAHGWLLFEENKMSKSRGNIVRTETILDVMGSDALRYFLLREVVFGQDGSFSFDALVQRYNSDLANGLGNLASRTLTMIMRYFKGEVPYPSRAATHTAEENAIAETARQTIAEFNSLFDQCQFSRALEAAWNLVGAVDKYIVETQPWALAEKQDDESRSRLATILYTSAEALRIVTALAHPVLPDATAKIWGQMGLGDIQKTSLSDLKWGQLKLGTKLGDVQPVFPRADKSAIERMQQMEEQGRGATTAVEEIKEDRKVDAPASPAAAPAPKPAAPVPDGKISIEDFAKVELRVGQVKVAERVKGADKLLRLDVDLGTEVRQVLAGIAEAYAPETLVGRKVVIVVNLAPRKLRGLESNGMIVAASPEGGKPVLASFLEDVPVGTRLK